MKAIHKYELQIVDLQCIDMPAGATFLHVDSQHGRLCLWYEVYPKNLKRQTRWFSIIGTGNPMPGRLIGYLGSVIMPPFVWHVYECEVPTS